MALQDEGHGGVLGEIPPTPLGRLWLQHYRRWSYTSWRMRSIPNMAWVWIWIMLYVFTWLWLFVS